MRAITVGTALATLLMILAPRVSAQYMYLDSNGDGINTTEDKVSGTGTTHVTVWLDIAHDRNGNPVTCNSHTGLPTDGKVLDLFEYSVTLDVSNGSGNKVNWGTYADSLGFFSIGTDQRTDSTFFFERTILTQARPPARYKLGSFDLTVAAGSPAIRISTGVPIPGCCLSYTIFGTDCPATANPNSYTLGLDWFDTDGLAAPSTVIAPLAAHVFSMNSNDTFRLRSGKPSLCVQIEPVDGDYENANVELSTLTMLSLGTGTLNQIPAIGDKTTIAVDRDRNGVQEITACFARADLENLFSQINGRKDVTVTLEGRLASGGIFSGTTTLSIIGNRASLLASLSPNPLNPQGTLTFSLTTPGSVTVHLYDLGGRSVRTVAAAERFPAGVHQVSIDGRDDRGTELASGVYFYRLETPEGASTGRFVVLK